MFMAMTIGVNELGRHLIIQFHLTEMKTIK